MLIQLKTILILPSRKILSKAVPSYYQIHRNIYYCCPIPRSSTLTPHKNKFVHLTLQSKRELLTSPTLKVPTCWKCSGTFLLEPNKIGFPLKCPTCSTLQEPSTLPNYYEIFNNLEIKYEVNLQELSRLTKELQRLLHPDLFTMKEERERELSEKLSSLVNKAYSTLQDPIQRGQYLLQLKGVMTDPEKEKTLDPKFLGEVMELNERLEEVGNPQEWKDFRKGNEKQLVVLEKELGSAFRKNDLKEAQLLLNKMKFYESLQGRLKAVQFKFGVVD